MLLESLIDHMFIPFLVYRIIQLLFSCVYKIFSLYILQDLFLVLPNFELRGFT